MKPRDLFGVGVRLVGVWLLYQGATYCASFADWKLFPGSTKIQDSATAYLIYAVTHFTLAAFFLLWTESLTNWTYGEDRESKITKADDAS